MVSADEARRNTWRFAALAGCDVEEVATSEDLRECLKKIPAEDLVKHNLKLFVSIGSRVNISKLL